MEYGGIVLGLIENIFGKIKRIKRLSFLGILLLISVTSTHGQNVSYDAVYNAFISSFDYQNIIRLSDELLKNGSLSDSLLTEVYMMRAATFLSLHDVGNERESLTQILKINKDYRPNTAIYSPNLLNDFNDIKTSYLASLNPPAQNDSTKIQTPAIIFDAAKFSNSAVLNLFIPGIGQIQSGKTTKGIILSAASTTALGLMISSIANANKKESDYLKETDKSLIAGKYSAFNSAYKTRNIFIVSYAAIWVFSQLDLLFNSNEESFIKENNETVQNAGRSGYSEISLGISIPIR